MVCVIKLWALLIVALINNILIDCEPNWTFDIVSLDIENRTPDVLFLDLTVTRPYRGAFAMSGICEFKEDITDQAYMTAAAYYSLTGADYIKTPFFIPKSELTTVMNSYYKDLLMKSILNCTDNAPWIENKFVAPLTKRTIHFNDCFVSNENLPSHVKSGYYKVVYEFRNQMDADVVALTKVEPKY